MRLQLTRTREGREQSCCCYFCFYFYKLKTENRRVNKSNDLIKAWIDIHSECVHLDFACKAFAFFTKSLSISVLWLKTYFTRFTDFETHA